jgi:hypothetical protein
MMQTVLARKPAPASAAPPRAPSALRLSKPGDTSEQRPTALPAPSARAAVFLSHRNPRVVGRKATTQVK